MTFSFLCSVRKISMTKHHLQKLILDHLGKWYLKSHTQHSNIRMFSTGSLCRNASATSDSPINSHGHTFTVCVEGNIGSGKTTFLDYFSKEPNVEIIPEPVDKWRNVNGINLLAKVYEDPHRWSFTFQKYVQLTMVDNHIQPHKQPIRMMERSIHTSRFCFVENHYQGGTMCDFDYTVFTKWYDWLVERHKLSVDLIVYLQTKPETVYKRTKERCRSEETVIPLKYLQTLHNRHEDWLIHRKWRDLTCPVLVFDANQDIETMLATYKDNRSEILMKC